MANHITIFVLGILANIASVISFVAPLPTFVTIYGEKSVLEFRAVPYIMSLLSQFVWLYYVCILPRGGVFLIAISAVGVAVQTAYIGIYIFYATPEIQDRLYILCFGASGSLGVKVGGGMFTTAARLLDQNSMAEMKRRTLIVVALVDVCMFVSLLLLTLLLVSSIPIRHAVVGWSCVAITVACFAAPLGILWQVIHTRSVEFMPFPLSLALLVTAALWLAYGLATDDIYIQIPNVVGIALGAIQILVYFYYGYLYPGFQHIAFLWGLAIV